MACGQPSQRRQHLAGLVGVVVDRLLAEDDQLGLFLVDTPPSAAWRRPAAAARPRFRPGWRGRRRSPARCAASPGRPARRRRPTTISVATPASFRRTASSTAISSKGFIDILTLAVSTPLPSALTRTLTLKSTTRLMATRTFMGGGNYNTRPMSDLSQVRIQSMRDRVSNEEWLARVDLAACYRLVHHYGMDDLVYNHISARVPGEEGHFLINAYGMTYDEITASSLVKIDFEGKVVLDSGTGYGINHAGRDAQGVALDLVDHGLEDDRGAQRRRRRARRRCRRPAARARTARGCADSTSMPGERQQREEQVADVGGRRDRRVLSSTGRRCSRSRRASRPSTPAPISSQAARSRADGDAAGEADAGREQQHDVVGEARASAARSRRRRSATTRSSCSTSHAAQASRTATTAGGRRMTHHARVIGALGADRTVGQRRNGGMSRSSSRITSESRWRSSIRGPRSRGRGRAPRARRAGRRGRSRWR